jgi:uncharacterized integral membrane protein
VIAFLIGALNSTYMPQVRYSHSYADREYLGERIGVVQRLASDYRSDAQLEMGIAWSVLVGVLLGIFFMVFAVTMLIGSN